MGQPGKTPEERERAAVIFAACQEFREIIRSFDGTANLVEWIDPDYKTAGILVRNKTWIKLDTREGKVFFWLDSAC